MAFVFDDDALGADVDLVVLAEELGALVGVLEAVLFSGQLLQLVFLLLLLGGDVLLAVEVVEDGEILYKLLDVGGEVAAAGGAGEDVGSAQVHEAVLTEGVAASEDARDLLLVVVLVEADGAGHFHSVVFV